MVVGFVVVGLTVVVGFAVVVVVFCLPQNVTLTMSESPFFLPLPTPLFENQPAVCAGSSQDVFEPGEPCTVNEVIGTDEVQ